VVFQGADGEVLIGSCLIDVGLEQEDIILVGFDRAVGPVEDQRSQ
jgi:hypothetical protein